VARTNSFKPETPEKGATSNPPRLPTPEFMNAVENRRLLGGVLLVWLNISGQSFGAIFGTDPRTLAHHICISNNEKKSTGTRSIILVLLFMHK